MNKILLKSISVITAFIIVIGTSQNAYAAPIARATPKNYYVDKNNVGGAGCNDGWAGTLQKPLCTITQGISLMAAGDSLFVRGGSYSAFSVTKKNSITISGYNDEMPVINGGTGIKLIGTSHVTVRGFEVINASNTAAGIFAEGSNDSSPIYPTYNVIEYNKVHDNNASSNTSGIMITDGSYNQILHNEIYNNYFSGIKLSATTTAVGNEIGFNETYDHTLAGGDSDGIDLNGTSLSNTYIHDNIIHGNSDDGLDTWNSSNNLIVGNIAYDQRGPGDGNGFKVGGGANGGHNIVKQNIAYHNIARGFTSNNSGGNVYYNNVAYDNNYGFEDANKNSSSTDPSTLINNIGYNNNMNFLAGPYTDISHNNIWYSDNGRPKVSYNYNEFTSLSSFYQATGLDNPNGSLPSLQANPLFTDAPGHVFTLALSSPAINAGDPSNPGQVNATNIVDIGAIESNLYPVVQSIICADPNPINATVVHFTITFTENVTGLDISDLVLIKDNGASYAAITDLSGSGNTYTVTVDVGAEDGSFHLNLIDDDSIQDAGGNLLGQTGVGNGDFTTGEVYLVDRVPPTILSLKPAFNNSAPISAAEAKFTITFSEDVFNVDANDFTLSTTGVDGSSISAISGDGATRTIIVNTGIGDGSVHLDAIDNDSITDIGANVLDGAGTGSYISTATYNINKPNIAAPVLRSPRNALLTNLTTPTLWWSEIPLVANYQLSIARNSAFSNIVTTQTVTGTSYTVVAPLGSGVYYWRVRAITPSLQYGNWSAVRKFTVDVTPPPVPVLFAPANNSSSRRTPTFKWRIASTAVAYEFQYDVNPNFLNPLYTASPTRNLVTPALMNNGTYYWRVRARDAAGNWSNWSSNYMVNITGP